MRVALSSLWLLACAAIIGACSGGGGDNGNPGASRATTQVTATPAGILPAFDQREYIPDPGATINPYRFFALDRVRFMHGIVWVADRARIEEIMRTLDHDVALVAYGGLTADPPPIEFELTLTWPQDDPPVPEASTVRWWFAVDSERRAMAHRYSGVEWPIPQEFLDLLSAYGSPGEPDAQARYPYTPQPTVAVPTALRFDHSNDQITWDGNDDRVVSHAQSHCGESIGGAPTLVAFGREQGWWGTGLVERDESWHWTGYSHADWQIWQGIDADKIYLVQRGVAGVALEYTAYGCI